jgi:hypothetical protein
MLKRGPLNYRRAVRFDFLAQKGKLKVGANAFCICLKVPSTHPSAKLTFQVLPHKFGDVFGLGHTPAKSPASYKPEASKDSAI